MYSVFKQAEADNKRFKYGWADCGHLYLDCANCNKRLVDIWMMTNDPLAKPFYFQAKCCYCGDKSYIAEVKGECSYGGIAIDSEDDCTNEKLELTRIGDVGTIKIHDGREITQFATVKGKDAK